MPCGHDFNKINDVVVCKRCGLIRTFDKRIIFDRDFINEKNRFKNRKNIKKAKIEVHK